MGGYDDYEEIDFIDAGSFGEVYKVKHKATGRILAWKKIVSKRIKIEGVVPPEIYLLRQISSPFLVQYVDTFEKRPHFYLVMEYCDKGDLREYINEAKKKGFQISEQKVWTFLSEITLGLHALHSHKILHRDLKPENIFLFGEYHVKIGDFGLAKQLDASQADVQTIAGTYGYLSPEALNQVGYNRPADIFSLGVIMYELITLRLPYTTQDLLLLHSSLHSADRNFTGRTQNSPSECGSPANDKNSSSSNSSSSSSISPSFSPFPSESDRNSPVLPSIYSAELRTLILKMLSIVCVRM
eukprot:MONOS_6014.1-p1 / transcript=MONOS_6014.1 / gene=MONOS_6014 / organism=Monocercomonoides_exilis_PA203 / gene_product=Serine / transcript_product=Serine / location=Mono_scaffold00183:58614-59751(-) / protein_length=297 / sequence_SO=supercontig / SO=protein_coding / is_pseudo=false